jgi:hypothetical protein
MGVRGARNRQQPFMKQMGALVLPVAFLLPLFFSVRIRTSTTRPVKGYRREGWAGYQKIAPFQQPSKKNECKKRKWRAATRGSFFIAVGPFRTGFYSNLTLLSCFVLLKE